MPPLGVGPHRAVQEVEAEVELYGLAGDVGAVQRGELVLVTQEVRTLHPHTLPSRYVIISVLQLSPIFCFSIFTIF